ncbi:MAG: hypothetical protein Q7T72_14170, partial [Bacteroidales bacterium]|nr:hypothetical protein [Bacteroidales bacterium]
FVLNKMIEFKKFCDFGFDLEKCLQIIKSFNELSEKFNDVKFIEDGYSNAEYNYLAETLRKFQINIINAKSEIAIFLIKSHSKIDLIWDESLKIFNQKFNLNWDICIVNKSDDHIILNVHPIFMRMLLVEILTNKYKYAELAKCNFEVGKNDKEVYFHYNQNSSFKINSGESGLMMIRNVMNIYNGQFELVDLSNYSFKLIFVNGK